MSRINTDLKLRFDGPATLDELATAIEDLRARYGGDALVRVRTFLGASGDGSHVKGITAHQATRDGQS